MPDKPSPASYINPISFIVLVLGAILAVWIAGQNNAPVAGMAFLAIVVVVALVIGRFAPR